MRIDHKGCTLCDACVISCGFDALERRRGRIIAHNTKCVACQRCVYVCPTDVISIYEHKVAFKENGNWTPERIKLVWKQSEEAAAAARTEEELGVLTPETLPHYAALEEASTQAVGAPVVIRAARDRDGAGHHFLDPEELALAAEEGWDENLIAGLHKQSEQGGILLTAMGNDRKLPVIWDHLLLDACQVTNPPIDPLREPMELRTYLGAKPEFLSFDAQGDLTTEVAANLRLETPIMFAAMSYGAISLNAQTAVAIAAQESGTLWNTGEGGLHKSLLPYTDCAIVQCASGRFGVDTDYLNAGVAIEIKIGQGAKPGIGGHLPGHKVIEDISKTRMIPQGTDALSPAPHHDIYSIEDLRQLIFALKEACDYGKPVGVKIAAVHNVASIASGIVLAGADFVYLDGFRGGSGSTPAIVRDHVGIPIEIAIAVVDERLRQDGLRHRASLIAAGSMRCAADVAKAIALGADAVSIGTAALITMGCPVCQKCYTGNCSWGIASHRPELTKTLNPRSAAHKLNNLLRAWNLELKEVLGALGMNAIESLRGNRERLRAYALDPATLEVLGVKPVGR